MEPINWGHIIVLSAPSGAGKNTLIGELMKQRSDLSHCISTTTRTPRGSEQNGEHYYFVDQGTFEKMIEQKAFLEYAKVLDNYYGTSLKEVNRIHTNSKKAILDIDVQGAMQIMEKHPDVTAIFIEPPSLKILKERLIKRGTETEEQIDKRMALAVQEMGHKGLYKYNIINDDLQKATDQLNSIIDAIP